MKVIHNLNFHTYGERELEAVLNAFGAIVFQQKKLLNKENVLNIQKKLVNLVRGKALLGSVNSNVTMVICMWQIKQQQN